jgi:hypothetical protein
MNLYFWKVQQKRVEIVQTNWILHLIPPVVQVETPEARYRITGTGISYRMAKPLPEQLTGCPFPGLVLELAVRGFLFRNRAKLPWLIVAVAALIVAFYGASAWLIIEHPAAGEMLQNALWSALLWTVSICATLASVRMFVGFRNSAKYVYESELARIQETKELTAGPAPEIDLGEDILVIQKEGESGADFETRLAGVRMNLQPGEWAVAFCFRHPTGTIWTSPTATTLFQRNTPPFQNEHWKEDQLIVPPNAVFHREEYPDFRWYCETFAHYYKGWAPAYKIESADKGDAANTWLANVKLKSAAVLLCLFCSFTSFGQSAAAVQSAIGTRIREIPEQGADVSYMFQKKVLNRIGNGRSSYVELLTSLPTYKDCCHGDLIAIYNGENIVAKGPAAETVADAPKTKAAAMRSTSAIPPSEVTPGAGWQMPDSLSSAQMAEDTKHQIWRATDAAGKGIKPWWDVVMFTLWQVFPFLIILGALSWLFAGVCAREGMYTLHKHARRVLAIDALAVAGVLLVNFLLVAVGMGFGPFALSLIAAGETYAAYVLVTWLVPDFRPAPGNEPRGRAAYFDQSRQLPG